MSKQGTEAPDQPMPEKALKELFGQSHDRGRAGLPVMSLSMGRGLVPRNQDERRVETNLSDEQHRLVRAGELAYNMMRMWQGVCGLAKEDCLISPAYVVVRPLNGMDPKFSEYLLTYEETVAQFKLLSSGVVDDRLRLYFKDFERVLVRIPSPPAQRKIARILTTLDNLIENTETLIAKYQAIKQGMMHDLFSRGVDARGHLRPPQVEAPALYKQTGLGWIPKAWQANRLGDVCETASGGTPSRAIPTFWNGDIPWVKTGEIRYCVIHDTEEKITKFGMMNSAARLLPEGTVVLALFGQGPTRGRVGILGIEATVNQACLAFLPSPNIINTYLYYALASDYEGIRGLSNDGATESKRITCTFVRHPCS